MKAVVLGVCPDATLVDIGHEIPPHDVLAGALELAACYRYFPAGTVFLVVVDPGVGSSRRGIAADTGDYRFVSPDNGVLTGVFRETPPKRVVELTERKYARPTISRTFEGRDRFAPAAGWLAKGIVLSSLGRTDYRLSGRSTMRRAGDRRRRDPRRNRARRSLRQPHLEHRSADARSSRAAGCDRREREWPRNLAPRRDLRRGRLRRALRALRQYRIISRSPSTAAAPPTRWA